MQDNQSEKVVPSQGGVVQDLFLRLKLMLRLMGDSRVNFFLKLIPLGSFVYLFFPDLVPGPIDDAAVIWLGTYLFVELCPPAVVEEHIASLRSSGSASAFNARSSGQEEEIIDAQWREQR
jgi:hypothetical protein